MPTTPPYPMLQVKDHKKQGLVMEQKMMTFQIWPQILMEQWKPTLQPLPSVAVCRIVKQECHSLILSI